MLMPGLDCSPNGPLWTNFAKFCKFLAILQQVSIGLFWAVFKYHFRGKLEENLATLQTANAKKLQIQTRLHVK